MNWKDLFYFSRGERRAFSLLFAILGITWLLFRFPMNPPDGLYAKQTATNLPDTIKEISTVNTSGLLTSESFNKNNYKKKSHNATRNNKLTVGSIVDLNLADTTLLKQVPGIGSVYAGRIVKYRNLLGGFASVSQLQEVYGIDESRYQDLKPWFSASTTSLEKIRINELSIKELSKHPYINYQQAKQIEQLRKQIGLLSHPDQLNQNHIFSDNEVNRILPYLSFD